MNEPGKCLEQAGLLALQSMQGKEDPRIKVACACILDLRGCVDFTFGFTGIRALFGAVLVPTGHYTPNLDGSHFRRQQ